MPSFATEGAAIVKKLFALVVLLVMQSMTSQLVNAQDRTGSSSVRRTRPVRSVQQAPSSRPGQQVRAVSHEVLHDPVVIDGDYVVDDLHGSGCDSCGGGGCTSCGTGDALGLCGGCNTPPRFCICFPSHGWVHAEYLSWYQDGMRVPALVTSSPTTTDRANAGVLGLNTTTLYGNDDLFTDQSSGFRIRFGWWLSSFPGIGLEGEYLGLGEQTESFFARSTGQTGSQILARPFYNTLTGSEASELVAFPNVVSGDIAVDSTNKFDGAAFRFRRQMCCSSGCGFSQLNCQTVPTSSRLDGTLGYRFWELKESIQVQERLTSLVTTDPGSFIITDRFETRNLFNGAELGVLWQGRRGWWSLDALMRLGIGNVNQSVTVSGSSAVTEGANPGTTTNFNTGFLAQSTNIGTHERNKFTMVPELGLTLGYQMTKRVRLTTGYSLIYWGSVVRPGDQIDSTLNPNLLAPQETAVSTPNRPQFRFVETDYYVQGLSFGGEFRW